LSEAAYENQVELTLPSNPNYMRMVRSLVGHMAAIAEFDARQARSLILATDEACSNIIKHGYRKNYRRKIVVRIRIFPEKMEIILKDFARKVDIKKIRSRALDEVRPGGLGVHIMQHLMDEVIYTPMKQAGTELKLVKYRRKGTSRK